MIRAPMLRAYAMACTARRSVPQEGSSPMNLMAMIRTDGATPATPVPFPLAAMDPATWVPWKSSASWTVLSSLQKSQPLTSSILPLPSLSMPSPGVSPGLTHARPARSGWERSTPSSITATTRLGLPVVICHASGTFMSTSLTPA